MITMTYNLAIACGWDAANRLMQTKKLTAWDRDCADEAAETFHRVYGHAYLKQLFGKCPECDETQSL